MVFNRILVVCVGNICRSPVAEYLLQRYMPEKAVASAGLAALVGQDMDPTSRLVAEEHGLVCPPHRATQLTKELCRKADLILVMESEHREAVTLLSPESRGKVFLLGGLLNGMEITDPYQRDRMVFQLTYERIAQAAESWSKKLGSVN